MPCLFPAVHIGYRIPLFVIPMQKEVVSLKTIPAFMSRYIALLLVFFPVSALATQPDTTGAKVGKRLFVNCNMLYMRATQELEHLKQEKPRRQTYFRLGVSSGFYLLQNLSAGIYGLYYNQRRVFWVADKKEVREENIYEAGLGLRYHYKLHGRHWLFGSYQYLVGFTKDHFHDRYTKAPYPVFFSKEIKTQAVQLGYNYFPAGDSWAIETSLSCIKRDSFMPNIPDDGQILRHRYYFVTLDIGVSWFLRKKGVKG